MEVSDFIVQVAGCKVKAFRGRSHWIFHSHYVIWKLKWWLKFCLSSILQVRCGLKEHQSFQTCEYTIDSQCSILSCIDASIYMRWYNRTTHTHILRNIYRFLVFQNGIKGEQYPSLSEWTKGTGNKRHWSLQYLNIMFNADLSPGVIYNIACWNCCTMFTH